MEMNTIVVSEDRKLNENFTLSHVLILTSKLSNVYRYIICFKLLFVDLQKVVETTGETLCM